MSGYEGETRRLELPCAQCGGTTFTWGKFFGSTTEYLFLPHRNAEDLFFEDLMENGFRVEFRMCDTCSNIQMFGVERT